MMVDEAVDLSVMMTVFGLCPESVSEHRLTSSASVASLDNDLFYSHMNSTAHDTDLGPGSWLIKVCFILFGNVFSLPVDMSKILY